MINNKRIFNHLGVVYCNAFLKLTSFQVNGKIQGLILLLFDVKNLLIGPVLPAVVSLNVLTVLVGNFNIQPNSTVEEELPTLEIAAEDEKYG